MESLAETEWDVVISGTGLQQSLLALALSRSGKNILHVDANTYYGGNEAAFSLQEVDEWAAATGNVEVTKAEGGLSFPRAYSIALAPQIIHTKSELLSQLVSSKAFRQIEFLAVGSFYIYEPDNASLNRIPSTREDVFSNTSIPAKSKRSLMKFLKFVLDYDAPPHRETWTPHADLPLRTFLAQEFKLDERLQADIITLTLSLDGNITVKDGLRSIHQHMSSMGLFGAGFAAVVPKWGGLSEVAQVGCRALAVGGAVYMLGTGIKSARASEQRIDVSLSNDIDVKTRFLVKETDVDTPTMSLARLTAVVHSDLSSLFDATVEGAPSPVVAVVAFPAGYAKTPDGTASEYPIYAMVHSSETGECPKGQCVIYLSTMPQPNAKSLLDNALSSLLGAVGEAQVPEILYRLSYTHHQRVSRPSDSNVVTLPTLPLDLAFNDAALASVKAAWETCTADDDGEKEYMVFEDREGADNDDYE
ncbi:rab protein geranylgeranyltransferase component A [Emericellopsis atlantica]|uniref:Rab proteins geranylgeranyltransferase n=1 Tax=Emericellopsis atlantica TaxID=2614577 RepID=A0A9P8CT83_9HYPO|nr:rab protein geranylgeranyltransferase component A [Emericellopsis atlantica]KAG9258568.1 rab protein geranylgeranyltransferase component A [Emericellopsis atlantica]